MSEDKQNLIESQTQASSEHQSVASDENTAHELQAAEPTPKPEPSFGRLEFSEDLTSLAIEKIVEPHSKPDPSFETHMKEAPRKPSQHVEKLDKTD